MDSDFNSYDKLLVDTVIYPEPLLPQTEPAAALEKTKKPAPGPWLMQTVFCLIFCLGALACKFFYPTGNEILQQWIIGTGTERIQVAVSSFDQALTDGYPVADAIAVFYDQITADAAP